MPTSTNVTNLKINTLTEAQYDTAVQGGVIGENELSIITDLDTVNMTVPSTSPVLTSVNWSSNSQTISVNGVTADNVVIVSPAPASTSDYVDAGIICSAQAVGTLTFTCDSVPSNDITLSVVIFD